MASVDASRGSELLAARLDAWANGDLIPFADDTVADAYRERAGAIRDALELRAASRVPLCPTFGAYPMRHGGLTLREAMYDYEKAAAAYVGFHEEHLPDCVAQPLPAAAVWETLGARHVRWPGHGLPDDAVFQFAGGENMFAGEYGDFMRDPSGFWLSRYLPRAFAALSPWQELPPVTDLDDGDPATFLAFFGTSEGAETLKALQKAGEAALGWLDAIVGMVVETAATVGIPILSGGWATAPYDLIAGSLRGPRGLMNDLVRRRDSVIELCESLVPQIVDRAVRVAEATATPIVTLPLHWGSDGFMSDRDFREVYWPSLKAVILGCVRNGVVLFLASEGCYDSRLEVIADDDIPPGRTIWAFDATDLRAARRALAGRACVAGNLPISVLCVGDVSDVAHAVDRVFDEAGAEPGFIFGTGGEVDEARPENVRAMLERARALGLAAG